MLMMTMMPFWNKFFMKIHDAELCFLFSIGSWISSNWREVVWNCVWFCVIKKYEGKKRFGVAKFVKDKIWEKRKKTIIGENRSRKNNSSSVRKTEKRITATMLEDWKLKNRMSLFLWKFLVVYNDRRNLENAAKNRAASRMTIFTDWRAPTPLTAFNAL